MFCVLKGNKIGRRMSWKEGSLFHLSVCISLLGYHKVFTGLKESRDRVEYAVCLLDVMKGRLTHGSPTEI